MPFTATVYNVFIASPGDVLAERDIARDVIYEWNAVRAESERAILQPIRWETHSFPDMGDRAQGIINRQILEKSDILVAIFWYRLGTATGVAESGTIEEIENHLGARRPAMIYFSSKDVPRNIDIGQLEAIRRAERNYQARGLIDTFANQDEFGQKFTRHLSARMVEYLRSQPPTRGSESVSRTDSAPALSRLNPSIASDAVRLLQEAARSQSREILRRNVLGGFQISAALKDFISDGERKTQARWKAALDELEHQQFVEAVGTSGPAGQIYRVTHAGDMFLEELTGEATTKFINQNELLVNVGIVVRSDPSEPQFNYVVRLPRSAVERYGVEWNMEYVLQHEGLMSLAISSVKSDFVPGTVSYDDLTFFLGDKKSLPKRSRQTKNNCWVWKL